MSAKTTLTATTHIHPCILSCGYKSIYIPKSGLEFPGWLVCFDTEPDNEQEQSGGVTATASTTATATDAATCTTNKTVASNDDSIEKQRRPCKKARQNTRRLCHFWRSKRDFWRLGRATAASLSSSSSSLSPSKAIILPKVAWKKLSNEAPWKRPDYNDYCVTDVHNDEEEVEAHVHELQNGWKRHMYKSLRQMDQYLQQVAQSICSNDNNNIHHDCNKMNCLEDQQQCKTCTVRAAWKEFCRPCHTEDLKDNAIADSNSQLSTQSLPPTVPAVASTAASIITISTAMTGNALGQYFCHQANARQLVSVCLEQIQPVLLCKNLHDGHETTQFLFVEPSCGHGQVLEALLDELERRQQQQQQEPLQTKSSASATATATRQLQLDLKQCSFVGMDIDPTAIAHCREHFSKRFQRHCSDDDNNNKNTQPDITWLTLDFLQSQRSCIMENLQVDGTRNSGMTEDNIMVIVLGGPPYSAGAGGQTRNGGGVDGHMVDGMQRDLPMRFVHHAKQEWGASIVTFLMPERCGHNNKSLLSMEITDPMQPNNSNSKCYELANIPLEAPSVFYFQGLASAPVKQPSIIQCFWRVARDETKNVLNS